MDNQEVRASGYATGLSPSVEPVPVSPADAASIPDARQMHMRWTTDKGLVVFEFPSDMSTQDADDVCDLLEITMKGIRRRAIAIETRSAETERLSPQGESAGPTAIAEPSPSIKGGVNDL